MWSARMFAEDVSQVTFLFIKYKQAICPTRENAGEGVAV
jgi:hypothetical protein